MAHVPASYGRELATAEAGRMAAPGERGESPVTCLLHTNCRLTDTHHGEHIFDAKWYCLVRLISGTCSSVSDCTERDAEGRRVSRQTGIDLFSSRVVASRFQSKTRALAGNANGPFIRGHSLACNCPTGKENCYTGVFISRGEHSVAANRTN